MAKCAITGKHTSFKKQVSHSHTKTSRIVKPNLQTVRVNINGTHKKIKVSARALKSGNIERV